MMEKGTGSSSSFQHYAALERVRVGRNPLTAEEAGALVEAGITHVLDLREESEWSAPNPGGEAVGALERLGVKRRSVPIPDFTAPGKAELAAACAFLEEALSDPAARVFVHCWAGRERSGTILTAFHARQRGLSCEAALAELQAGCPRLQPLAHQLAAVREWLAGHEG
jgi:protein-tyrosine phosphatase